jgi:hypothetical protein
VEGLFFLMIFLLPGLPFQVMGAAPSESPLAAWARRARATQAPMDPDIWTTFMR